MSTTAMINRQGASSRDTALEVVVIDTAEAMESLTAEWEALSGACPTSSVFQTAAWHKAWWRAFGGHARLRLLTFRADGRLVGVLALMLRNMRVRGMAARVLSTFDNRFVSRTDILAASGDQPKVAARLAAYLLESSNEWDITWLQQLPSQAKWFPAFAEALREAELPQVEPVPALSKYFLPLAGSWDDYLASKSRHFRVRNKEDQKRVQRQGKVNYRHSSGGPEDFRLFEQLEAASWKHKDSEARLGPEGWAFQSEVALTQGAGIRCHNLFLEIDGKTVGGLHAVGYGGCGYSLQTLFDESVRHLSPGRAQFSMHVKAMFDETVYSVLDLNSDSEFCKSWSQNRLEFVSLQVFNRRPYSRLLWLARRLNSMRT